MEEPKEQELQQQPEQQSEPKLEHCPYCGKELQPGQPCQCPQGRMMSIIQESDELNPPEQPPVYPVTERNIQKMKRQSIEEEFEEEDNRPFWVRLLFPEIPEMEEVPRSRRRNAQGEDDLEDWEEEEFDEDLDLDDFDEEELEEWEQEFFSPQAILHQFLGKLFAPFRNFFPFLIAYLRAPMRATEAACRGRDLPLGLLYLLLFLSGGGACFLSLTHRCGALLGQALSMLFSLAPFELPDPRRLHIQVRDGRCFFYGMLIVFCLVLLSSVAVSLSCRLVKVKLGICRALVLCSVSGLLPALLLLAAAAALGIAPVFALALAALAFFSYFALVFHAACRAAAFPDGGVFCLTLVLLLFLAFATAVLFCADLVRPSIQHLLQRLFS